MTTLELIGLLLPLTSVPEILRGQHIVLGVDNVSVVHAWENKNVKGDITASCLVRAMMVIEAFLECKIYVRHVMRMSTRASQLADALTRDTSATENVWAEIAEADAYSPPEILWDWLKEPKTDWQLGFKIVDYLKQRMS